MSKKWLILAIIILACLALVIFLVISQLKEKNWKVEKDESSELVDKTKDELEKQHSQLFLASGNQVYEVLTDKPKEPQVLRVEVNPLDVEYGKEQIIIVKVESRKTNAVTDFDSVTALVKTDNKHSSVPLKFIKAEGEDTLITWWQGTWERNDSYENNYVLTIEAKNIEGESSVDVTFR